MDMVNKKFRGKIIKVIYNCPCDSCPKQNSCKIQKTYCSAFTEYVNYGWFSLDKVQKRLKKL